jgi:hypothetical protein
MWVYERSGGQAPGWGPISNFKFQNRPLGGGNIEDRIGRHIGGCGVIMVEVGDRRRGEDQFQISNFKTDHLGEEYRR